MSKANVSKLAYVGATPGASRDSDSWYTPSRFIEAARAAMGSIDLDPFSSAVANTTVKAKKYLTVADDALTCAWSAKPTNVWMNPPYSGRLVASACDRFMQEYDAGVVRSGIVLVNNATDTRWFQKMASKAAAICFTAGRISFENADGKNISGNTRGQAFFYFGKDTSAFKHEFAKFGIIVKVA